MNRMKRVVLLLLVAVGSNADPEPTPTTGPDHCNDLKSKMQLRDVHTLNGKWELHWSSSNSTRGNDEMANTKSNHVEFNYDNTTMRWTERNENRVGPDKHYILNVTLPSGPGDAIFYANEIFMVINGTQEPYPDPGVFMYHKSPPDHMVVRYRENDMDFLLKYVREGTDLDAETLKTNYEAFEKRAECLGFSRDHLHRHGAAAGSNPATEDPTGVQPSATPSP